MFPRCLGPLNTLTFLLAGTVGQGPGYSSVEASSVAGTALRQCLGSLQSPWTLVAGTQATARVREALLSRTLM